MSSPGPTEASFHGRIERTTAGHGRHRPAAVVATWVVGLGLVVGFAAGGPGGTVEAPRLVAPPSIAAPSSAVHAPPSIRLDRPARRDEVVTTRDIIVRGQVSTGVAELWVMLESRGGKPLESHVIDPTGASRGGMRPFESRFQPTMHRPAGSVVVFVVAVDGGGTPIGAVRRRIQLGAVANVRPVD